MILSQRYPTVVDGIISGDPAMRTGLSTLAIWQVDSSRIQPNGTEGQQWKAAAAMPHTWNEVELAPLGLSHNRGIQSNDWDRFWNDE